MRKLSRRAWIAGAAMAAQAANQSIVRLPQKVRVAIIGLEGHIGEILEPLDRLPDVELVAIQDRDPALMREVLASKHGAHARLYGKWRDLLDGEKLDIVGICGTNGERAEIIFECAKRKLNIVAEKPLAIAATDLDRIKKAVADSGIHLTMLIEMRFQAPYRALKQIVESGDLGEVAQIGAQKSYKLGQRPDWMRHRATFGGTIAYIAVHMVDLMRWTTSRELVEVFSYQGRVGHPELQDMENVTTSLFKLDNGGTAALRMDYLRPDTASTWGDDRLRLAGTHGVAEFQEASGLTLVTEKRPPRQITDLPPGGSLFIDFLNSVYSGHASGLSLRDIYRVNEIVLAARDSADQHRLVQL
ncbi:MAG: Gfo/Idh/MocA family oxidoreductase [Acidobacteriia bacterium]|nr:Gfo/Idh/MocA family oxidoreductase [Terriglobia bacterium]